MPRRDRSASEAANLERIFERFAVLADRRGQVAGTLSGGEQQQLAIARALMAEPKVILYDEPSLGLAPRIVDQIFALIGELRDEGVTSLLVEQNAHRALGLADRGYVLSSGRVIAEGSAGPRDARQPRCTSPGSTSATSGRPDRVSIDLESSSSS